MFGERCRRIEVDVEELLLLNNNEKGGESATRRCGGSNVFVLSRRRQGKCLANIYLEAK
jgi:hypothetical protein